MKQELSYVVAQHVVGAAWRASDEGADEIGHLIALDMLREASQQLDADELRLALEHCVELAADAIDKAQRLLAERAEGWLV